MNEWDQMTKGRQTASDFTSHAGIGLHFPHGIVTSGNVFDMDHADRIDMSDNQVRGADNHRQRRNASPFP